MTHMVIAAAGTPFYSDSSFWVLVPLVLFFVFIWRKGAFSAMGHALDQRAVKIQNELDEARRLREEAQALLASYQRQQKEAEEQAESIIEQARRDAEIMAQNARKDLEERLERRAALAETKIANAEAQALKDVRARATDVAIDAAKMLLADQLKTTDHARLVKNGIAQISTKLN